MSTLTIPNTAVANTTILSADFNGNMTAIAAWANGSIDDANLVNAGITASSKLKGNSINQAVMGLLSVGTPELIALSVTAAKLAANAVESDKIGFSAALIFALDYSATGRIAGVVYENVGDSDITVTAARLTASGAPSTTTEEISIFKLPTSYTDPDSGGTAINFTTSNPQLLTTETKGTKRTATGSPSLNNVVAPGEALAFNCVSLGAPTPAADVSIHLEIDRDT